MRRLACIVCATIVSACEQQEGWLEVVIEAGGLEAPEDLDALEVDVVASRTASTDSPSTCIAAVRQLNDQGSDEPLELPFSIVMVAAAGEWRCVAVRATGLRSGEEVVRAEELYCPGFDGGTTARLVLDWTCHADAHPPECADDEVCEPGPTCSPSPLGRIFDAAPSVETSCESG
jgi:hypothetical protein